MARKSTAAVAFQNVELVTENDQVVEQTNETTTSAPVYSKDELIAEHKTKSAVIRFLDSQGMKKGEIAKLLDIRYQHVRNVLITPIKKVA